MTRRRPSAAGAAPEAAAVWCPVEELVPWPRNPRVEPSEATLEKLGNTIRELGWGAPLLARAADRRVIAGHTRLLAARRLGLARVPVRFLDVTEAQADALALADNRLGQEGGWDHEALARVLRDAQAVATDLKLTGFDEAEIAPLLAPDVPGADVGPSSPPPAEAAGDADAEPDDDEAPPDEDQSEGARLLRLLRPLGLRAPFPWFGGKRRVAGIVWAALGNPRLYVEPFAGSLATLLARPPEHFDPGLAARFEHVNDLDAYVANFWRATAAAPEDVARAADWPVNEADLYARHKWLVNEARPLVERVRGDPEFFDAKVAGWWAWGLSAWIGGGWCTGALTEQLPHLGGEQGVTAQLPHLGGEQPHLGGEQGVTDALRARFRALRDRLRRVRVCCGDWARVLTLGATVQGGDEVGVFLDPPYDAALRADCYAVGEREAAAGLSVRVREWALAHGEDPRYRVVLAGYAEEHGAAMPPTWRAVAWTSSGAYQRRATHGTTRGSANRTRERLWLSPGCLPLPACGA